MSMLREKLSIVIPAKNEAENLKTLLPELRKLFPEAEIIVVNDGSNDESSSVIKANGIKEIYHHYSKGNGASVKAGARIANHDVIVFMDGDGQHKAEDIERFIAEYSKGYDMVVGARNAKSQASIARLLANSFYNSLSSWISGRKILDLTSGFRIVNAKKFKKFLYLLPNGFSYPTTSTMAFFRAGYSVSYIPIETAERKGESHISLIKDGLRFLVIIFKIGTLYSPLKIFLPFSAGFFGIGLAYYIYTYFLEGTFTNMSAVLFMASIIVFLIGLVSEQVTALMYKDDE